MAASCTPREGEKGSLRPVGAGFAVQAYDLVVSGGTTTLADVATPFLEIESILVVPSSPAGAVGIGTVDATDPTKFDLAFTADTNGVVYVTGRGF